MGGECRSLEVLYLLLLGRALRKERKERKVQHHGHNCATTQTHRKKVVQSLK